MKRLLLVLFLCLLAQPAWAVGVTKYLDNSGGSGCANGGTNYNPQTRLCASGSATVYTDKVSAFDNIGASNTLLIRTGTYSGQCTSTANKIENGSPGNPTIISNYPGEAITLLVTGTRSCLVTFPSSSAYISFIGDNRENFIIDGDDHLATDNIITSTDFSTHHITLDHITVKNAQRSCIFFRGADTSSITIRYSHITGCGDTDLAATGHGVYIATDGALIEHNEFNDIEGWGIHCFDANAAACDNSVIRYNLVYDFGQTTSPSTAAGIVVDGDSNLVYRNSVRCNSGSNDRGFETNSLATNTKFYNNSITNCAAGAVFADNTAGSLAKNNIVYGNTTAFSGASVTYDNNLCAGAATGCEVFGDPKFADATNSDLRLLITSAAIDAGVVLAGFTYNGSLPDIGAFETIVHPAQAGCVVDDGAANTLKINFTNNVNPPLLPATGIAFGTNSFTTRKATVNNVVTAATLVGTNRIDLTLTNAIVNGNAVDYSYSFTSGNVTDSSLQGGSLNQPLLAITNQACTNNVGAAASHSFNQATFEFHGLRGTEAAPVGTPYASAPEDTNIYVRVGGSVRLRLAVTCTDANCPSSTGFYPRYSCPSCTSAGTYTVIPNTFVTGEEIGFCGTGPDPDIPTNGTPTTDQLTTSGTFFPGAFVRTSNAIPAVDLAQNEKTELEYCFSFSPSVVATNTYSIRLYQQDGTALTNYTVTPIITIQAATFGSGF